jgi:hypothetical protein
MKRIIHATLLAFVTSIFVACDLSDPGSPVGAPDDFELNDDSPAGQRVKKAFEDHGVLFRYEFTEVDYAYDWTGSITSMPYVPATNQESIIKMIDFIEQEVFSIFPDGFIKEYMPPKILMVDSLKIRYTYYDELSEPPVSYSIYKNIQGNVTSSSLTISGVNEHFVGTSEVKEELISIFVERLLANSKAFPWPEEFLAVTEDLYNQAMEGVTASVKNMYYPYWSGDFSDIDSWMATAEEGPTDWLGRGILKPGRLGDLSYDRRSFYGYELTSPACAKATLANDFADFVVFILTKTVAEKEAFYAYVESIVSSDARYPQGGPLAAAAIRQKVQVVKEYFKTHAGVELRDPQ